MTDKKIRVVLVDDHTLVREAFAYLLEAEKDIQVVAAVGTAAGAEEAIRKTRPDVVIMDIELPDKSGLNLAVELRTQYEQLNIIFLTMHHHEEYALRGLRSGAQGYLLKTSHSHELLEAVREVAKNNSYITREVSDRVTWHIAQNNQQYAFSQLSDREFQVLRGLAMGRSCKELAKEFELSVKTIYTYRTRLLEKLKLKNDIDILRYAQRHHLLSGEDEHQLTALT